MRFLRETWYLAAWADEVRAGALLARTIAAIPVVMFRDAGGAVKALHDQCPHRFAPLSRGRLEGGQLRCGYHGLVFGADGACVANPHGEVPAQARAIAFVAVERHEAVWLWLGDPARADPAAIPDCGFIDRAAPQARVKGYLMTRAHYQLMVDNILDLTHADYLHADSLGGGINSRAHREVVRTADGVLIRWTARGERLAPAHDRFLPVPGDPADFLNEVHWSAPGFMRQRLAFAPAGELENAPIDSATIHVMTPADADSTHYFFCHTSDPVTRDPSLAPIIGDILRRAFSEEDAPMIEAQHARIGARDFTSLGPVVLPTDAATIQVRRKIESLLDAEAGIGADRRA